MNCLVVFDISSIDMFDMVELRVVYTVQTDTFVYACLEVRLCVRDALDGLSHELSITQ